jgi:predicted transcriptional regulator
MSFQFGYLTPKQRSFWRLRFDGLSQVNISNRMGVTRQTVNKAFSVIDSKVAKALLEAAHISKVEISKLDMEKGFLLGHSRIFGLDTLGIQIWYRGEGRCSECEAVESCREKLLIEAKVRGVDPQEYSEVIIPSKLADLLFEKVME